MPEQYTNGAQSFLNGAITAGATSLVVASASGFPTQGNFRIVIDREIMLVTAVAGNTFTVTRAAEPYAGVQAAAAHDNLAAVTEVLTAASIVPTGRQVGAGTGLAGGGDLTADRTLSVLYGTTSTTACAGNDSRLSDSRTPTGAAGGDFAGTYPNPTIKASVGLTGTPTAPTAAVGTNTTQIATTAFVLANAGSGAVSSVSNSDGTLTISPTTGGVVASLNLGHANTWTAQVNVGATCGSSNPALYVEKGINDSLVRIRNTNATGYNTIDFYNNSNAVAGTVGSINASAALFPGVFWVASRSSSRPIVFAVGSTDTSADEMGRITSTGTTFNTQLSAGATCGSSNPMLYVEKGINDSLVRVRNTNATGYSTIDFYSDTNTAAGATGICNGSAGLFPSSYLIGAYGNRPIVFSVASTDLSTGEKLRITATAIVPSDGTNFIFGTTTGSQIGTSTSQKLAFWGATPAAQQVLATGAGHTVDDVITLLQSLGLCRQS